MASVHARVGGESNNGTDQPVGMVFEIRLVVPNRMKNSKFSVWIRISQKSFLTRRHIFEAGEGSRSSGGDLRRLNRMVGRCFGGIARNY